MLYHFRCKGCKGDMLVISARDQNDLFIKRAQPRDGARGTCGNGIVIPLRAVQRAHIFDAVLHARKAARSLSHHVIRYDAVQRRHSGKIVFDVVQPRQANIRNAHDLFLMSVMTQNDRVTAQKRAVRDRFAAAEKARVRLGLFRKRARDVVILIKDGDVVLALVEIDILLRRDVLVHILVHIQMVRRKVGHHRDVRRALHIQQLERRELNDRNIIALHLLRVAQQRVADVAAEVDCLPRCAQHICDDARRGGLAVAARHADDRARADLEKDLHLRRHDAAA